MWSLLTVWAEQNLLEDGSGQERDDKFLEIGGDSDEYRYQTIQKKLYKLLMEQLLHMMEEQGHVELKPLFDYSKVSEHAKLLDRELSMIFGSICIKEAPFGRWIWIQQQNEEQGTLLEDMYALLGSRCLVVIEQQDIIKVNDRFSIQNMLISWGEQDDNRT